MQGSRSRTLTPTADGQVDCRVEMRLDGLLAWLVPMLYGKSLQAGMAQELAGLKRYAEARAAGHAG